MQKNEKMKKITLLLLIIQFEMFNLYAQINIQLPETFTTYQIPKNIKGENQSANASINYLNNNSLLIEYPKLKLGTLRFPGGSFANSYNWKKELNDTTKFNLKNAIHFAQEMGMEINYMLNFGNTTAQEAAELVRICNSNDIIYRNFRIANFGVADPINIRKWELGNELSAKWEWHYSWLAGGQHTVIHYQTGDSLYFPRTITDSLHYFGGEIWRKGWVTMAGENMDIINSNLGTIKRITSNNTDTLVVKVKFGPIYQDSVIVRAVNSTLSQSIINSLTQQEFYDLMVQPQFLLDPSQYEILGDSAVKVYPNTPLNADNLVLVEYKTKHPGAFEIRDSMMLADPTIEIGYCIDFRKNLLGRPAFDARLIQSPPRFIISHPYNKDTDIALSNGYYSEILYLAEKKATIEFPSHQIEYDSIVNAMGLSNPIGIGLTEWNIRLCGDGNCNISYNGILGGLYTANFYTQFYEATQHNLVDLRVSNHFAGVAEGNNLIHMFHYKPAIDSTLTTAQSNATRIINNTLNDNLIYIDTTSITGNPYISILDADNSGVYTNVLSKAVKIFQSIDTLNSTFNVLLLNQDDENDYTINFNTPASWISDTVFIEKLTGELTSDIYDISLDTISINNNQFTINIDSFSLTGIKIHCDNLLANNEYTPDENYFTIYPNPSNNILHINSSLKEKYSIRIYSTSGQLIKHISDIDNNNYSIPINNLKSGLYFVQIYSNKHLICSRKLVIE
jgi:hypothetical protein